MADHTLLDTINEAGQIIGTSGSLAFLYTQGKMIDFNTLPPQGSGWKALPPAASMIVARLP